MGTAYMYGIQDIQSCGNAALVAILNGLENEKFLTLEQKSEIIRNYSCFVVTKTGFLNGFWKKIWHQLVQGKETKESPCPYELVFCKQVSHQNDPTPEED